MSSKFKPVGQHPITTASTGSESVFLSDVLLFEKISAKSKNIFALKKKMFKIQVEKTLIRTENLKYRLMKNLELYLKDKL
jgi:hypothetical protein